MYDPEIKVGMIILAGKTIITIDIYRMLMFKLPSQMYYLI